MLCLCTCDCQRYLGLSSPYQEPRDKHGIAYLFASFAYAAKAGPLGKDP
jgi:hypothetical protein